MAQAVPALPRLQVWQPRPPPRPIVHSRPVDSQAQPREPSARTSPPAVRPRSRPDRLLHPLDHKPVCRAHRPPLRLDHKPVCRAHRPPLRLDHKPVCRAHRPPLRLDHKPVCPAHRPPPYRGRRGRQCSPRLRVQSRHQARRRTLQETSGSAQVRTLAGMSPTSWQSPGWGQLVGLGRQGCGSRGSIRGR
jgi:hypothetical protein